MTTLVVTLEGRFVTVLLSVLVGERKGLETLESILYFLGPPRGRHTSMTVQSLVVGSPPDSLG